jgi:hypothetical protein
VAGAIVAPGWKPVWGSISRAKGRFVVPATNGQSGDGFCQSLRVRNRYNKTKVQFHTENKGSAALSLEPR